MQTQPGENFRFKAFHFGRPRNGMMIISQKVQQTVNHQMTCMRRQFQSGFRGIARNGFIRKNYVAKRAIIGIGGKRQDIGCPILAGPFSVQAAYLFIAGENKRYLPVPAIAGGRVSGAGCTAKRVVTRDLGP